MQTKEIHPTTTVFVTVIKRFILFGIIKSKTELCESIGHNKGTLSDILNGKRNVTLDFMFNFIEKYSLDANIFFKHIPAHELDLKIKEIAKQVIDSHTGG